MNKKRLKLNVFDKHRYIKNACLIAALTAGLVGSGMLPQISKGNAGYKLAVGNVAMAATLDQSIAKIVSPFSIMTDGTVWTTGNNCYGQLGLGDTTSRSTPTQVPITNVANVVSDGASTFFIKTDGTIWATGNNSNGQLGLGDYNNRTVPTQVPITNVVNVIQDNGATLFLKSDNTVWVTGAVCDFYGFTNLNFTSTPTQAPIANVAKIVISNHNDFFIKTDGTVFACGYNRYGALGLGFTYTTSGLYQVNITNVANIVSGVDSTFFIKTDGTVWATGSNSNGQLGLGDYNNRTVPAQVPITNVANVVSDGYNYTFFIKTDGTVWANGINGVGQLGLGDTTNRTSPIKVNITNVANVVSDGTSTFFIKTDGTVWATGSNSNGQLGLGDTTNRHSPTMINLWNISNSNFIIPKNGCTIFVKQNGEMWFAGQEEFVSSTVPRYDTYLNQGTAYIMDTIYNLSDIQKYGSWFKNFYGKSVYDNNEFMNFTLSGSSGTSTMHSGGIIQNESLIRGKYFLDNGVMILIDNYGMVQYYKDFSTTSPDTLAIDGDTVDHVDTLVFGNGTIKPVLYMKDGSLKYVDTDESIHDMTLKQSDIVKTFAYKYANGQSQKMLIQKPDGSLVYLDDSGNVQNFGINMNDVAYMLQSTDVNKDLFVMKGSTITLRDDTGTIAAPSGLTINKIWSNRIFEMSDGYLYTLQNGTFKKTTTLAKIVDKAKNQAILLKNGNFQTVDASGNLNNLADINGSNVKSFVQLDSTNQYILMNDGTTYGIGTNVQGDKLESHGIDINSVKSMISNGATNISKVIVMDSGDVYVNQNNSWVKSTYVKLNSNVVNLASAENGIYLSSLQIPASKIIEKGTVGDSLVDNAIMTATAPADKTAPTITASGNPTDWTNSDATINVTATDETGGSGVANITLPDGTVVNGSTASFKATQNGTYTVKATDKAGNVSSQTVTVNKIDKTAPTAPAISNSNGTVTITGGTDSDSGVKETDYSIDGGAYQKYTAPFTLTGGSHTIKAKSIDNVGNTSAESSQTFSIDKTAPTISVSGNPSSWQNTDATISVTATDETGGSGVSSITLPDGTVVNGSTASFKATQNGTYTVKSADKAGNVSSQTVTVNKIDKTAPTAPAISNSNGTVTITGGTDSDSGVKETDYSIDGGIYEKYTVPFALDTGNHTIKAETIDNTGNSSAEVSDNITVEDTALKNAAAAVANAESTVSQTDLDSAKSLVDALPDSQSKTDLENRIQAVQNKINQAAQSSQQAQAVKDATDAVNKAQQSQSQSDLDNVKEIVSKLPEGADKTNLENQINSIQDSINKKKLEEQASKDLAKANVIVQRAENTVSQADVDSAKSLVDALPDSQSKTDLENRLQAIQDKIDADNVAIKKVEDALSNASSTLSQDDITAAQEAINELPAGIDKVQYNNQLRIIQQKVQITTAVNINNANAAVTKVSRTKSITDLNTATNLVNSLSDCIQKTKLNNILNIIKRFCK